MAEEFTSAVGRQIASPNAGERVELFLLDARAIGSELFPFTPAPVLNAQGEYVPPQFGGQIYTPAPVETSGWEWSGDGPMPQPRITVKFARPDGDRTSFGSLLLAAVRAFDDLIGATLTRIQTFRNFLDDGDDADPEAHRGLEIYEVKQRLESNGLGITLRLGSPIDQEGVSLPRRQAYPRCGWLYRVADGEGGFDYSNAVCPYTGPLMFDALGNVVADPALDICGKSLTDCKLRFGATAELPFGGFPAIGRTQL